MSIDTVMAEHGFNFSASCGGKGSYTKWIKYKGKRAYVAVTDAGGEGFPTTLEEPVRVAIHDLKSRGRSGAGPGGRLTEFLSGIPPR